MAQICMPSTAFSLLLTLPSTATKRADGESALVCPLLRSNPRALSVLQVGSAVTRVQKGDEVLCSFASCDQCAYCKQSRPHGCTGFIPYNFGRQRLGGKGTECAAKGAQGDIHASFFGQSGFGYHALVAETSCVKVPKGTDLVLMSPLGCGLQSEFPEACPCVD